MPPNLSLNPDASSAALRAVRSAPISLVRYTAQEGTPVETIEKSSNAWKPTPTSGRRELL
jgi:hypothetical protein